MAETYAAAHAHDDGNFQILDFQETLQKCIQGNTFSFPFQI